MNSKPLVIVTRRLPELVEARMMELFNTRLSPDDNPLEKEELIEAVKEADILVPTVTDKISSTIIMSIHIISIISYPSKFFYNPSNICSIYFFTKHHRISIMCLIF